MRNYLRRNSDLFNPLSVWLCGMTIITTMMVTIENTSIFEAVWYSIVTASTVGYGGIIPQNMVVRVLSLIYILTSIGSLAAFIGALSGRSKLFTMKKRTGMIQSKTDSDVIIIGYPSEAKVKTIVKELKHLWKGVVITCITNQIENKPEWMQEDNIEFIQGRASERDVLERANVIKAKNILVLANDPTDPASDEYTSSAVMMCETINSNAHTIAEKVRDNKDLFTWASCDKIVDVCRASELVHEILYTGAIDFIDAIFSHDTPEAQKNIVVEMKGDNFFSWCNVSKKYISDGTICLGFSKDEGKTFTFAPKADTIIRNGDIIKVITRN